MKNLIILTISLFISFSTIAQLKTTDRIEDNSLWFREAGFGMFIHWGLYSIPAGMWKGEPVKDNRYINPYAEHIMMLNKIPIAEYAKLADTFNPVDFNAEYIVGLAKKNRNEIPGFHYQTP